MNPGYDNQDIKQFIQQLDEKFKNTSNKYEISMNQLQQNILENQKELMSNFTLDNPVIQQSTNYSSDDDFQFGRIC